MSALNTVRDMCAKNPKLQSSLEAAYGDICEAIETRALTKRPKPKVFEVHHEREAARELFLKRIAEGAPVNVAASDTRYAFKL